MGSILASAGRPAQWPTTQDVHVGMPHGLATILTGIGDEAVTGDVDALLAGDLRGEPEDFGREPGVCLGDGRHVREVLKGDHQDVHRGLGFDVTEGNRTVSPRDDLGWDVARGDPAKKAFAHAVILTWNRRSHRAPPSVSARQHHGGRDRTGRRGAQH